MSDPEKEIEVNPSVSASTPVLRNTAASSELQMPQTPVADLSSLANGVTTATALVDKMLNAAPDTYIPWEDATLPSEGVYYEGKLPGGVVKVRAMGIHADKILATARLAQTGQSIDYLFNHCVQLTEGFDQSELLAGDRIFLLYVLRGITHGNIYEFIMKCPNCEASSPHVYDLNQLASTIQGPKLELGDEPFKVTLPYMSKALGRGVWVKVRFMRGKDVSTVANRVRFNKKVVPATAGKPGVQKQIVIDQAVTENLALIIKGFGGPGLEGEVTDGGRIKAIVDRMHASDTATIRQFLRDNAPGIDTTIKVTCPDCNAEYETELPITESFFRPASNKQPERA